MSNEQKYRELVQLLKDTGVMQLDDPWAQEIQALVKSHKGDSKIHQHEYHLGECACGAISPTE